MTVRAETVKKWQEQAVAYRQGAKFAAATGQKRYRDLYAAQAELLENMIEQARA